MWLPISASVLLVGVDCYNTISHLRYLGNLGNLGTQVSIENKNGGLYEVVNFLNSKSASKLMFNMVANDASVQDKLAKYSFWSRNDLELGTILCTGIEEGGIRVNVSYNTGGKRRDNMNIVIPFSAAVSDENELKNALLTLVLKYGKLKDTAVIVQLPFGEDHTLPENLQFNNVPHEKWVRKFLNEAATLAVLRAVDDPLLVDKSRLQIKVNFPEVRVILARQYIRY